MTEQEKQNYRYRLILRDSGMARREIVTDYIVPNNEVGRAIRSILNIVEQGKNVYIWSQETGNGKTMTACEMAKQYASEISKHSVYGLLPIIVCNFGELMTRMKEEIDTGIQESVAIKDKMKNARLLVIDDVGTRVLSEYDRTILYDIVNHRFKEMLTTIITSNVPPTQADKYFGKQIASRIVRSAITIEMKGADRR